MKCDKNCFECRFDDCINGHVYPETDRYAFRPEEQKQYQRDYQKRKRDEARAQGLCIICRREKATYGSKCYECYIRQKRFDHKRKNTGERERRLEEGRCYFCGAECMAGRKTCIACWTRLHANAERLNQHPNTIAARKKGFGMVAK